MNTTLPLISVVVPIYGVADFLCACIDSILAQTYTNLEIILVDDGSPDNCPIICDEYAQRDSRIVVIHQPNGGTGKARNVGIQAAHGEFISFVDSDDFIHPDMLNQLYLGITRNNCDMSVCFHQKVKEHQLVKYHEVKSYSTKVQNGIDIIRLRFHSQFSDMVIPCNKLFKKELFSEIRFPEGKMMEDIYTIYKTFFAADKIAFLDIKLYYYTQRHSSVIYSSTMKAEYTIEAFDTADDYCRRYITDKDDLHQSLMILTEWKANACLDAYYAAYRRGQPEEMERYRLMYLDYKNVMKSGGYMDRTMKLSLFDLHPAVFRFAYHIRNKLLGVNDLRK